jgi:nucleoside-diphosphate-sugar epimerase
LTGVLSSLGGRPQKGAKMKVLVSGATGFMGYVITRHLLEAGHEIRALSRSAEGAHKHFRSTPVGTRALAEGRLKPISGDVTRPETLVDAVEGVDAVVQAAQFPGAPIEDPGKGHTYMQVDRDGTLNMLAALAAVYQAETAGQGLYRFPPEAPWVIYLSGVTVGPAASWPWDRAKWQAEEALRGSGVRWTIVRPAWTFGPGDRSLNRLLGFTDFLPFLPIFGSGNEELTPLFSEDLGRLFVSLFEEPGRVQEETIPLGAPEVVTMNEFLKEALRVLGRRRPILHIPKRLGKSQAFFLQFLPGRPLTPGAVEFSSMGGVADLSTLRRLLPGFEPTPMRAGLEESLGG